MFQVFVAGALSYQSSPKQIKMSWLNYVWRNNLISNDVMCNAAGGCWEQSFVSGHTPVTS